MSKFEVLLAIIGVAALDFILRRVLRPRLLARILLGKAAEQETPKNEWRNV